MRRAALVVGLLAVVLVAPVAASPQPTPVCRFCGGQFQGAATDVGVNATVDASEVVVQVNDDGTATWTVRLTLTNGADAFADAPDRLERAARVLLDDSYGPPQGASFVDARLESDVAVLEYRDADGARQFAGLLVVDYFHERGGEPRYHVNADSFTVRGPPGTVVANRPDSGRVTNGDVRWTGSGAGEPYEASPLEGSPYVVFGPDRSAATRLRAAAAVALATLPIVVGSVRDFLLFQTALFTVLLGVVTAGFRRWSPSPRPDRLAGAIAVLGLVGIVVPAVTHGPAWVTGPPILGLGLAALVLGDVGSDRLDSPRGQALAVGALLVVAYGLLVSVHLAVGADWTDPPVIAFRSAAIAFPFAAMVPLGGALRRSDRIRPWFALAVVAFVLVPVSVVDFADPPTGLGGGLTSVAMLGWAVVGPAVGSLGLALGWSLAGDGPAG